MKETVAAAYIRVSTEDQSEYSPDAQLRELRAYAIEHGLLLYDRYVFTDEGRSGRSACRRQGFLSMIQTAMRKDHPFDVILVHKYDRFARSREDSVVYKAMLRRCGVEVVSIKEPIAEGNYSGVLEAIYESLAEAYSVNLAQEVKKGMTEKARRGELQTSPPFGYRAEGNRLVPIPEESEWVALFFEGFSDGKSCRALAQIANEAGLRTKRGNPFEARAVRYILSNPVYIGMLRWNPVRRSPREVCDPERIIAAANHAPIIDRALWDRVQSRLAQNKAAPERKKPPECRRHRLSGLLRCAACGGSMIWTNGGYFRCARNMRGSCEKSQHLSAAAVDEAVEKTIRKHLLRAPLPAYQLRKKPDAEEARLVRESAQIERKKRKLAEGWVNGTLEDSQFSSLMRTLNERLAQIRQRLPSSSFDRPAETELVLHERIRIAAAGALPDELPVSTAFGVFNAVVDQIVVSKESRSLVIEYRFETGKYL